MDAEDVQVVSKPRRRTYTAEYKRGILRLHDQAAYPAGDDPDDRTQEGESKRLDIQTRGRSRGRVRLPDLAGLTVLRRSAYPAAEL